MMAPRLAELRRVLKPSGSIYLHCDPTASHYLKILMDAVFRPENFRVLSARACTSVLTMDYSRARASAGAPRRATSRWLGGKGQVCSDESSARYTRLEHVQTHAFTRATAA